MLSLHNVKALPEPTAKTMNAVRRLATCWMARVSDSSGASNFLFSIGVQRFPEAHTDSTSMGTGAFYSR